ncbi:stage II sporulation protein M [Methylocaldum gracile]|uniref:stage II sporulation protein M n=1 Tax=Methylocaldum sp. 0917 TaxID=2485163 RepID=UPI0010D4F797
MKEYQFIETRRADWEAWDRWLAGGLRGRGERSDASGAEPGPAAITVESLPRQFRGLCRDLSLARDRRYSEPLLDALRDRVLAVHQRIYGARRAGGGRWLRFVLHDLPVLVRSEARLVWASAALFFLPLFLALAVLQFYPDGVYFLLSPETVGSVEEMYAPTAERLGRPRDASDDVMMLGFYIANNVRIDFQCFAGGIAFGLGSVFFLIYNGLVIGAVAGHLTQVGYIETFWGFVAGHSAPELIGAVLSGAAGLKIGLALIAPGRLRRADAVKRAAQRAVHLLYAAAGLTFCAAFVEAFWSPIRTLPVELKYGVGTAFWLSLLAYFSLVGRSRRAA